jgi:hypothetical protein
MANLVASAAALADLPRPLATTTAGRSDSGPEEPFAAALVNSGAARVDGGVPPPRGYDLTGHVLGLEGRSPASRTPHNFPRASHCTFRRTPQCRATVE